MAQSITHAFAPGQQEDATSRSPRGRPAEHTARPTAVTSAPPAVPAAPPEALLRAIDKKPGHRLLARGFDLLLFTVLFEAALIYLWPQLREGHLMLLALAPGFLFYLLLDAVFMVWFGATPGKSLLRIQVVPAASNRIGWRSALKRSFRVGWNGLAMGLPGINLVTLQVSRRRLLANGRTTWDQQGSFYVLHGRIGVMRTLAFIVCSLLLVMAGSIIRLLGQDPNPSISAMAVREADIAPPIQVEPSSPVLPGAPSAPPSTLFQQQGADDASPVQLLQDKPTAVEPANSSTSSTTTPAVAPASKAEVYGRHVTKRTFHHTLHSSALLPAARTGASRHAVHQKKLHASVLVHPHHTKRIHHAEASARIPAAGNRQQAADNRPAGDITAPGKSNEATSVGQSVNSRVSTVRQGAIDSAAELPEQAAQEKGPAWQPITASQAMDTDSGAAAVGNVSASTDAASQSSYPVIGNRADQAAGESGRHSAMANDAVIQPRQHLTGLTAQPAAMADGANSAGVANQLQSSQMSVAVPDAGQASIPTSAQFADSPINLTSQMR